MLETRAIVISLDGHDALVESTQGGGCGNCDSVNGCSSSKLSQIFCSEPRRFRVRNDANAQVGALVQVSLPEGMLVRTALLIYILPLGLLFAGAVVGGNMFADLDNSDVYSAIGGLAGLVSGFVLAKIVSLRQRSGLLAQPVIQSPTI